MHINKYNFVEKEKLKYKTNGVAIKKPDRKNGFHPKKLF